MIIANSNPTRARGIIVNYTMPTKNGLLNRPPPLVFYSLDKISKFYVYFVVVFNKSVIPLWLVGCEIIQTNPTSHIQRALVECLLMIFLCAWLAAGARDVDEEIISFSQTSW